MTRASNNLNKFTNKKKKYCNYFNKDKTDDLITLKKIPNEMKKCCFGFIYLIMFVYAVFLITFCLDAIEIKNELKPFNGIPHSCSTEEWNIT